MPLRSVQLYCVWREHTSLWQKMECRTHIHYFMQCRRRFF